MLISLSSSLSRKKTALYLLSVWVERLTLENREDLGLSQFIQNIFQWAAFPGPWGVWLEWKCVQTWSETYHFEASLTWLGAEEQLRRHVLRLALGSRNPRSSQQGNAPDNLLLDTCPSYSLSPVVRSQWKPSHCVSWHSKMVGGWMSEWRGSLRDSWNKHFFPIVVTHTWSKIYC